MDVPNHITGRNSESNFNLRFKSVLDNFRILIDFKGTSTSGKNKHIVDVAKTIQRVFRRAQIGRRQVVLNSGSATNCNLGLVPQLLCASFL